MSLSLWAHVACVFLLCWNVVLLAMIEAGEMKPAGAKTAARILMLIIIGALVLVWKALP